MLKAAVIGCGAIGKAHLRALRATPEVQIAALVDTQVALAREAARDFGGQAYAHVADLPGDIHMATVATPPMNHFGPVKVLLERGIPVLSEKPLTMEVAQAETLAALSARKGMPLLVGFKMRFAPIFSRARELVRQLGALRAIVTAKMQPYSPRPGNNWVPLVGAMYELSIHDFDLVRFITGLEPAAVSATLNIPQGWQREKEFAITVRYDGDILGSHAGLYVDAGRFMRRDFTAQFIGERGYMILQRPDRICLHLETFTVETVDPSAVDTFVAEMTNFRDVVLGRAEPATTALDGVIGTRLVEAAFASGRDRGRWVTLGTGPG